MNKPTRYILKMVGALIGLAFVTAGISSSITVSRNESTLITAEQQTMDKLMRGEEVGIADLRLITPATAAQQAEAWCIRHKVPTDQQVPIINRVVHVLCESKIRLCEPILAEDMARYAKTEQ